MSRRDENLAVSATFQTLSTPIRRNTHDMYVWIQKKQQIPFHRITSKKKMYSSKKQTFYLSLSMFETVVEVFPLIKLLVLNFGPHLLGHLLIESVVMSSACFDPGLGPSFMILQSFVRFFNCIENSAVL